MGVATRRQASPSRANYYGKHRSSRGLTPKGCQSTGRGEAPAKDAPRMAAQKGRQNDWLCRTFGALFTFEPVAGTLAPACNLLPLGAHPALPALSSDATRFDCPTASQQPKAKSQSPPLREPSPVSDKCQRNVSKKNWGLAKSCRTFAARTLRMVCSETKKQVL